MYIGSSGSLSSRKNRHFRMLRTATHYCAYLQNSYNKHGSDNFSFVILETCPKDCDRDFIVTREQFWIDLHWDSGILYNSNRRADVSGRTPTPETIKRMSAAKIGKYAGKKHHMYGKKHTPEALAKMSVSQSGRQAGDKHPMYGKKHKQESIAKMSDSRKGITAGDKHPMHGKRHSDKTRGKMSAAKQGKGGESCNAAKLTWEKVNQVRMRYAAGDRISALARVHGVSPMQIRRIVTCVSWVPND